MSASENPEDEPSIECEGCGFKYDDTELVLPSVRHCYWCSGLWCRVNCARCREEKAREEAAQGRLFE